MRRILIALAAVAAVLAPAACASQAAPAAPANCSADANAASGSDLVACMTAHGVAEPTRWAAEVEEYRPYDDADPTMAKLATNLAKYHITPAELQNVLASLHP